MDAETKKLVLSFLAILLKDDEPTATPATPAPRAKAAAPKAAPKAQSLRHMAANGEPLVTTTPKLQESFPMAEGALEFDPMGNVRIIANLKSHLVVRDGDHFDTLHQYGDYQMKIWTYGPTNVTFSWPGFLRTFGDSTKWQTVPVDVSSGGVKEIPQGTKDDPILSQYLEEEGGDNKFRISWRRVAK